MKKLMCAKCGGAKKKMAKGGSTKLAAAGIPYAVGAGQTDGKISTMKNGGKVTTRKKMGMGGMHKMPDGSMMKNSMMKKGGAKKGFPDLTGDGKVTMKDILKGRGVIKKRGGMVKRK